MCHHKHIRQEYLQILKELNRKGNQELINKRHIATLDTRHRTTKNKHTRTRKTVEEYGPH